MDDFEQAEQAEDAEPHDHDRAEEHADGAGAAFLDHEQEGQDAERQRNHVGLQRRRHDFHAFHGREHGNGRGDHAVAVEQRGGENAEQGHGPGQARIFRMLGDQGEQRQRTAFPAVVGTHDDGDVLGRDQGHDRPEDQRQDAEDVFRRHRDRMVAVEDFLESVEGAGPDVAENDTDGGDGDRRQGLFRVHVFPVARLGANCFSCYRHCAAIFPVSDDAERRQSSISDAGTESLQSVLTMIFRCCCCGAAGG